MGAPVRWVSANPTAQEVLAYPVWQGALASTAMPARRNGRRCRFRSQWNRRALGWGTLMRHFLVFRSITALPFGVGMATSPAGLIAVTGSTDGGASGLIGTLCGAVAVTSVAVAANDHRGTATRTQLASSWNFHGQ